MQIENIYPPHGNDADPAAGHTSHPSVSHSQAAKVEESAVPSYVPSASLANSSPTVSSSSLSRPGDDKPIPVLEVLSVRGVEYGMMTIVLWIGALTLGWVILNFINGSRGFNYVVVPTSALVVCVPIFSWFFLRLKRAELADPGLRFDPSKRRWSQITQILAYTAVLVNLIYFVYTLLQHASSTKGPSVSKAAANLVVILVIAGGVLFYYWRDEHRLIK
jgi:hypothetical protein